MNDREKCMTVREFWRDADESIPTKIFGTPIIGLVRLIEKIKDETGFDILDNPAINKKAEMDAKGKEWDKEHPVGKIFKHLGKGTARGLIGHGFYETNRKD